MITSRKVINITLRESVSKADDEDNSLYQSKVSYCKDDRFLTLTVRIELPNKILIRNELLFFSIPFMTSEMEEDACIEQLFKEANTIAQAIAAEYTLAYKSENQVAPLKSPIKLKAEETLVTKNVSGKKISEHGKWATLFATVRAIERLIEDPATGKNNTKKVMT